MSEYNNFIFPENTLFSSQKQDQNNQGQSQKGSPENDSNQLLMVDAQIRQTNPLLNEINKLIQVKTNVYNNIKSEMESKLKI